MAKAKFDMGEFVRTMQGNVSNLDTPSVRMIPMEDIGDNQANFYAVDREALGLLMDSIAMDGLQQYPVVMEKPDRPGKYVLLSGHRRLAAIRLLVQEEGREDLRMVPCSVRDYQSAAMAELQLILANSTARVLTGAELSRQAERMELLLYQLKEEGYEFPGRMRDQVAAACQVSAPKLARLKVIRERLITPYMELFEGDKLPEQTAYALARLPEAFQLRLSTVLATPPRGSRAEKILTKYNEGWRWEPALTCPDGKACKRGDTFLRRDCECEGWQELCGGKTCCLECEQAGGYSPCDRMCSKAKAQRKLSKDEGESAALERRRADGRKYQEETQRYAKLLLGAIEAAGLPEEEEILWETYTGYTVASIRQWAAGEFDDPAGWYYARLTPGKCTNPAKIARQLHCSTDFLLGLTEDLRPTAQEEVPAAEPVHAAEEEAPWSALLDDRPVRQVRWESRGRTPPVGRPILTYQMTNDGPEYRPAVWTGSMFQKPNRRGELAGLQYTQWLEFPPPGSGEVLELAEGQLVLAAWMPGGTLPSGPCDIVADFRMGIGSDGVVLRLICWFDGEAFVMDKRGTPIEEEVVRWMALPPAEEEV